MERISIIVPVYKVEPYLDRCVQSIVDQTYSDLEIILVDDGSPDECGAMCDAWAAKDSRIRVIHKENGGLSDARNAGMAIATGALIGFVDGDDHISPDMFQLLADRMQRDDSDIVACGVEKVFEDETPSRMLTNPGECVLTAEEAMLTVIEETWLKQPVWYKLYKTELVRDIPFPVGKYHEDVFWTYRAVGKAKRVSVFDTPCYFYTQRRGSIMGAGYSLSRLDALDAKLERLEYVKKSFPALEDSARKDLQFSCMYAMQMCLKHLSAEHRSAAKEKINRVWKRIRLSSVPQSLPIKNRLWLMLGNISLEGACRLRSFLKIGF